MAQPRLSLGAGWGALALAWALAGYGLWQVGDPGSAQALWALADARSGGDLAEPLYVDAMRAQARIRPWQPGFAAGRARIRAVEAVRAERVAHTEADPD